MSDVAPIRPPDEVELAEDQRKGLDEANGWVSSSLAVLGECFLEFEDAKMRYELAEKKLRNASATARQSEKQRGQVASTIAGMLELGEGEWVYDGNGKMVRKND